MLYLLVEQVKAGSEFERDHLVRRQQRLVEVRGHGGIFVEQREPAEGNCNGAEVEGHWMADACPQAFTTGANGVPGGTCPHLTSVYALDGKTAGVVCCNVTDGRGVELKENCTEAGIQDGQCECYGGMYVNPADGQETNLGEKTWDEAKAMCETRGQRLCTLGEVLDGRACGAGCLMDCHYIWTANDTRCLNTCDDYEQGACCVGMNTSVSHEDCCSDENLKFNTKWSHGLCPGNPYAAAKREGHTSTTVVETTTMEEH